MAYERKVDVVLTGKIAEGRNIDDVKAAVGETFRRSPPEVDHLFASVPFFIKRDLPESQLPRYLELFARAGALVEVKPAASAAALLGSAAQPTAAPAGASIYGPAPPPGARANPAALAAVTPPLGGFALPAPTTPPLAQSLTAAPSVYGPAAPPVGPPPSASPAPGVSAATVAPSVYGPAAPPLPAAPSIYGPAPPPTASPPVAAAAMPAALSPSPYNTVVHAGTLAPLPAAQGDEKMVCPKCGAVQGKRTLCLSCGVDMPRYKAAHGQGGMGRETVAATGASFASTGSGFQRYSAPRAALTSDEVRGLPSLMSLSMGGRIGRLRFLAWQMPMLLVAIVLGAVVALAVVRRGNMSTKLLVVIAGLGALFLIAYSVRLIVLRLHDLDKTGWFALLLLFPLLNLVFALYLVFVPGSQGSNAYGAAPEDNTPLVYVGAALAIALQLFGLAGRSHF